MEILLTPPLAILILTPLVILIFWFGKKLAGVEKPNPIKTSPYGSGEAAPTNAAAPGYRPFFMVAFFFAILHLGMLVIGTSSLNMVSGIYIVGLILALVALVLG
jgi:NADH:ubiquinone oxidoreductase subunit 3 (subunit A)